MLYIIWITNVVVLLKNRKYRYILYKKKKINVKYFRLKVFVKSVKNINLHSGFL